MKPTRVLLVENGTAGGAHARSNLAVMLSVHQAWPDADLFLACTEEHHLALQDRVAFCSESVPSYCFVPLPLKELRDNSYQSRIFSIMWHWYDGARKSRKVLSIARLNRADLVIDLWSNGVRIIALKILKRLYALRYVAFIHFEHNWDIGADRGRLKRWLLPHTLDAQRVLGNSGHAYALLHGRMLRDIADRQVCRPLDKKKLFGYSYPICWPEISIPFAARSHDVLRFGYVSPSFKGFHDFVTVVKRVHAKMNPEEWRFVEFQVVGKVIASPENENALRDLRQMGVIIKEGRLGEEQYARAIAGLDYALHVYDHRHYRIRFSSSLQDTLAFRRPAVMASTGYAEWLREIEPQYGYLVSSLENAADVVVSIVRNWTERKYSREVESAGRLREKFSVSRAAAEIQLGYALAKDVAVGEYK